MFEKILVPIDGSESSHRALGKAIKLGKQFNSEIYVLSVAPEASMMRFNAGVYQHESALNDEVIEITIKILEEAKEKFADYPHPHYTNYIVGDAAREILNFTKDHEIKLIVMGNRGMGAFSRTILGSVSNKIVNSSPVSVLVVKDAE